MFGENINFLNFLIMKKSVIISTFALVLGLVTFFSMPSNADAVLSQSSNQQMEEDDAIYCKVTRPDGTTVECWFCNCKGLAESASPEPAQES